MNEEISPGSDRGHAVLAVATVVVVTGLLAIGAARFAVVVLDRQQAQSAADAAALAALEGGHLAANEMASLNGAVVVSLRRDGSEVTVVVQVGEARAVARASDGPSP